MASSVCKYSTSVPRIALLLLSNTLSGILLFFSFKLFFYYQITDFHVESTTEKKAPIFVGFNFYILLKSTLK